MVTRAFPRIDDPKLRMSCLASMAPCAAIGKSTYDIKPALLRRSLPTRIPVWRQERGRTRARKRELALEIGRGSNGFVSRSPRSRSLTMVIWKSHMARYVASVDSSYLRRHEADQRARLESIEELRSFADELQVLRSKCDTEMENLQKITGCSSDQLQELVRAIEKQAVELQMGIASLTGAMKTAWRVRPVQDP